LKENTPPPPLELNIYTVIMNSKYVEFISYKKAKIAYAFRV